MMTSMRRIWGVPSCVHCCSRAHWSFSSTNTGTKWPRGSSIAVAGLLSTLAAPSAYCQKLEPSAATRAAGSQEPSLEQVNTATPQLERKQFAFTTNPLNLVIGRYGFNFEYQPVAHHGLIVSLQCCSGSSLNRQNLFAPWALCHLAHVSGGRDKVRRPLECLGAKHAAREMSRVHPARSRIEKAPVHDASVMHVSVMLHIGVEMRCSATMFSPQLYTGLDQPANCT